MATNETLVSYPLPEKLNAKNDVSDDASEVPSFYPPYKWGLGYASRTNSKFFIKDILALKPMPMFPMAYEFHGHPIYNVEIVGNVFLIDSRRQMDIYGVDDGTGCLKCVVWKPQEATSLVDVGVIEEIGAKLSKAKLGALVSFTGRLKTYKEKNELTVNGCHVLDSWKELVVFRSLTINAYESLYFRPVHLPQKVDQALGDYFLEKVAGKKSRRWFESQIESRVIESLDGEKSGQLFSLDFLEDETVADLLRQRGGCCSNSADASAASGDVDVTTNRTIDATNNNNNNNNNNNGSTWRKNNSTPANNVQKSLMDVLAKMESKGTIYFLPFGSHKAHVCALVDRRCALTQKTLARLKHMAKAMGSATAGSSNATAGSATAGSSNAFHPRGEAGFSVAQILGQVRAAFEEFCLVRKVAVERCLEILENESEVYSIGKYRFMPVCGS